MKCGPHLEINISTIHQSLENFVSNVYKMIVRSKLAFGGILVLSSSAQAQKFIGVNGVLMTSGLACYKIETRAALSGK
jgi:hypothetical protein